MIEFLHKRQFSDFWEIDVLLSRDHKLSCQESLKMKREWPLRWMLYFLLFGEFELLEYTVLTRRFCQLAKDDLSEWAFVDFLDSFVQLIVDFIWFFHFAQCFFCFCFFFAESLNFFIELLHARSSMSKADFNRNTWRWNIIPSHNETEAWFEMFLWELRIF